MAVIDDAGRDSTYVTRALLSASGTYSGYLNNRIDPVYGPETDFDYFVLDMAGGPNDGPGTLPSPFILTVTFEPGNAYFYRVGARMMSYAEANSTTYYPGSRISLLRHEPGIPGSNTFRYSYYGEGESQEALVVEIVGGGPPSGGLPYTPLAYTITLGGATPGKRKLPGTVGNDKIDEHTTTDNLSATGSDGDDLLWTGQGDDDLEGGRGRDILIGDNGADRISGDDDNDQLLGGGGRDTLLGGAGFDYLNGEWDDDSLFGGDGNDLMHGGLGADSMDGGDGDDELWGGSSPVLNGDYFGPAIGVDRDATGGAIPIEYWSIAGENQSGDPSGDTMSGGAGNDRLYGGNGNDLIYGNTGSDLAYGNTGDDLIFGGQGNDTAFGGQGNDRIYGNLGDDQIYGNLGNDRLFGGQGNDMLFGGQGNDLLFGNLGDDTLVGGLGADTFTYAPRAGSTTTIIGYSRSEGDILDFQGRLYDTQVSDGAGGQFVQFSGGGQVHLVGYLDAVYHI